MWATSGPDRNGNGNWRQKCGHNGCAPLLEAGVAHPRHRAQQPPADSINAILRGQRGGFCAGPSGREVLQAAVDEREHFVAAPGELDPQPSAGDRLSQRFGVPGQAEEPVLLGEELRHGLVLGAAPVAQFGGRRRRRLE